MVTVKISAATKIAYVMHYVYCLNSGTMTTFYVFLSCVAFILCICFLFVLLFPNWRITRAFQQVPSVFHACLFLFSAKIHWFWVFCWSFWSNSSATSHLNGPGTALVHVWLCDMRVCACMRVCVWTITFEQKNLWPRYLAHWFIWTSRSLQSQGHRRKGVGVAEEEPTKITLSQLLHVTYVTE